MELIQEIFRRLMKLFGNQGQIFGKFNLNIVIKSESSDENQLRVTSFLRAFVIQKFVSEPHLYL